MKTFLGIVLFLAVLGLFNFSVGYINSMVLMVGKRDKKLKELEKDGFKATKKWDCNYMTIAIDENSKKIACVVIGLTTKIYTIDINDIVNFPEVKVSGPFKKFVTTVGIVFSIKNGQYYFLRTLTIKKGFGVLKSSKIVENAKRNAEEIVNLIKFLKK